MFLALVVNAHFALPALQPLFVDLLQQTPAVPTGHWQLVLQQHPVVLLARY